MITYCENFLPNLATLTKPLRSLMIHSGLGLLHINKNLRKLNNCKHLLILLPNLTLMLKHRSSQMHLRMVLRLLLRKNNLTAILDQSAMQVDFCQMLKTVIAKLNVKV